MEFAEHSTPLSFTRCSSNPSLVTPSIKRALGIALTCNCSLFVLVHLHSTTLQVVCGEHNGLSALFPSYWHNKHKRTHERSGRFAPFRCRLGYRVEVSESAGSAGSASTRAVRALVNRYVRRHWQLLTLARLQSFEFHHSFSYSLYSCRTRKLLTVVRVLVYLLQSSVWVEGSIYSYLYSYIPSDILVIRPTVKYKFFSKVFSSAPNDSL